MHDKFNQCDLDHDGLVDANEFIQSKHRENQARYDKTGEKVVDYDDDGTCVSREFVDVNGVYSAEV